MTTVTLNLDTVELTDEQFYRLCQMNRDWQFERTLKEKSLLCHP
jgi:Uma2 family endonuclease